MFVVYRSVAYRETVCFVEWEVHSAAEAYLSGLVRERVCEVELGLYLGAAQDEVNAVCLSDSSPDELFGFDLATFVRGEKPLHCVCAAVLPVCGSEGVVDVDVCEVGEAFCDVVTVGCFAVNEPYVFEEDDGCLGGTW